MNYIALICARGGSKGLPGKNIKPLKGVPLIGHAINLAKTIDKISRIIVSTDSNEIASVAIEYGAEVPFMRPKQLALDNSPEWLVWRHAISYLEKEKEKKEKINGIIILPTTAPLRNKKDINNCIDKFENSDVDSVITVTQSHRNPYFNMVEVDKKGLSSIVIDDSNSVIRRQDAPTVYDMTTVAYVLKTDFINKFNGIFEGKVGSVLIPPVRSIDIDTELDFKIANFLINN